MKKVIFDFIDRNKPIFCIGAMTALIFLVIIVTASKLPRKGPSLSEIKEEDFISDHTPVTGIENAKVVIIEFSDFQCPACAQYQDIVEGLLAKYPQDIQLAYRHFPLPQHPNAKAAAVAAQAVNKQGKFWEYAKLLFENQDSLTKDKLLELAVQVGADKTQFENDIVNPVYLAQVEEDVAFGEKLGLNATPTFYVNGKVVDTNLETEVRKEIERVTPESTKTEETTQSVKSAQDQQVDDKYGVLELSFTNFGFTPANTRAVPGQMLRIKNGTTGQITIAQRNFLFKEFTKPVEIAPGEYFEFRVGKVGMKDVIWTYIEKVSGNIGSTLIISETQ